MNIVALFIKDSAGDYQRIDFFKDESVSVTSKIQDIRDISKVFTDFSQSFTLPASKTNNKIFKHFYNYHISEGAFDARKKVDSFIEINTIPFRNGKVLLNGVKMKDNLPSSYNITFFGNTVTLKDALGDDELSSLDLSAFDHSYGSTEVKDGLTTGINFSGNTTSVIYPLITHTKRLYFDTSNSSQHSIVGNISYDGSNSATSHNALTALQYRDLKPALKVTDILSAIEAKYSNVSFATGSSDDFFSSDALDNLYMWMSRLKGRIGGEGEKLLTKTLGAWQHVSGDTFVTIQSNGEEVMFTDLPTQPTLTGSGTINLVISPTTGFTNVKYSMDMIADGQYVFASKTDVNGTQSLNFSTPYGSVLNNVPFKFVVKSKEDFSFNVTLTMADTISDPFRQESFNCGSGSLSLINSITMSEEIPKMKTIDFLSGLFNMFNLTAFYIDDKNSSNYGKIKVMKLDEFYAPSDVNSDAYPSITHDITKYVISEETDIEATVPFSEINFNYEEGQTLLMKRHQETFNNGFGDEEFALQDIDRGKPYDVKVPFEHMKFERLFNDDTGFITFTQWGYSASDNFKPETEAEPQPTANYEPVLTKPVLFYGIRITGLSGTNRLNYLDDSTHDGLTSYWKPSNTNESGTNSTTPTETGTVTTAGTAQLIDSSQNFLSTIVAGDIVEKADNTTYLVNSVDSNTTLSLSGGTFSVSDTYKIYHAPKYTLNFDNEIDEWSLIDYNGETNSLFKNFYQTYILDAFNAKKRIFRVTAQLPNKVLLNYKMNDKFQIAGKVFTINSIDTNLKTGQSKLELLNVL